MEKVVTGNFIKMKAVPCRHFQKLISLYLTKEQGGKENTYNGSIHNIRFRFFEKVENIFQITDAMNLDWKTVKKYVDKTGFNEPSHKPASDWRFCSKETVKSCLTSTLVGYK